MTQDEIIALAREAGAAVGKPTPDSKEVIFPQCMNVERFASLVAEATLEKAAKVCEGFTADMRHQSKEAYSFALNCAAAIRSMK